MINNKNLLVIFFIVTLLQATTQSFVSLKKLYQDYVEKQDLQNLKTRNYQPEQIHISYGSDPTTQMIITWTTLDYEGDMIPYVEYGPEVPTLREKGFTKIFKDGGSQSRQIAMHQVLLSNLKPNQIYKYHCGSKYGWSSVFFFKTMQEGQNWSPRFAVFGDMGNVNAQSLPRLQEETMLDFYDTILHVGDFAYDMHSDNARVGDAFMNQIQTIAAYLPYMTCPGNHEQAYNFSNYVYRFNMPSSDGSSFGGDNNHFYSINIGPVHIISFSSEFYYFLEYGFRQIINQYEWLENDLKVANLPENRAVRPWIITMAHRPMYCSNSDRDDCTKFDDRVRKGLPFINKFGLEDLFYKYGVDLQFYAHEHSYERLWPIYDYKVLNGSEEEPYHNPRAPVHIVTGSAGCQENHDDFVNETLSFSAFRAVDYGYTRMQVFNYTHLYLEQVSDDKDGKVIDSIWLIKDNHGPYEEF